MKAKSVELHAKMDEVVKSWGASEHYGGSLSREKEMLAWTPMENFNIRPGY